MTTRWILLIWLGFGLLNAGLYWPTAQREALRGFIKGGLYPRCSHCRRRLRWRRMMFWTLSVAGVLIASLIGGPLGLGLRLYLEDRP